MDSLSGEVLLLYSSTNRTWYIHENVQNSRQTIDTLPLPWYPLTHINHFTVIHRRYATTPNHFAAACPRQNPLVPCGAVFFISRENLQPGDRPAILHTAHLENCMSRLDLDTAPRPRTKCGRAGQRRCNTGAGTQVRGKRRTQTRDTSIRKHSPAFERPNTF